MGKIYALEPPAMIGRRSFVVMESSACSARRRKSAAVKSTPSRRLGRWQAATCPHRWRQSRQPPACPSRGRGDA
nr:hypothetical protein Itr_chr14CG11560 [Ipomoea trifida]